MSQIISHNIVYEIQKICVILHYTSYNTQNFVYYPKNNLYNNQLYAIFEIYMILAHSIIGITLGNCFGYFWFFVLGSIFPDIDHLIILIKYKIFSWRKIVDSVRFEKEYNITYKTKYIHSVFGAIIVSIPVMLIDFTGGLYFFLSYIIHLLLDWLDIDEKQFFYPFKKKFKGFLPIFSKTEMIFTLFLIVLMILSFKNSV